MQRSTMANCQDQLFNLAVQLSRSDDHSVHNSCVEAPDQSSGFDDLSAYNGGSCAVAPAVQPSHPKDLPICNDGSFVESPALQSPGFDLFDYSEGSCVEALAFRSLHLVNYLSAMKLHT